MKKILILILACVLSVTPFSSVVSGADEEYILASYIEGAAGEKSLFVMISVGAVILNRVSSPLYSSSVTTNGDALMIMPEIPSDMALFAAAEAISGYDPTGGALRFYSLEQADKVMSGTVTLRIEGFIFEKQALSR